MEWFNITFMPPLFASEPESYGMKQVIVVSLCGLIVKRGNLFARKTGLSGRKLACTEDRECIAIVFCDLDRDIRVLRGHVEPSCVSALNTTRTLLFCLISRDFAKSFLRPTGFWGQVRSFFRVGKKGLDVESRACLGRIVVVP